MIRLLPLLGVVLALNLLTDSLTAATLKVERDAASLTVRGKAGAELLRYQLEKPADTTLASESACYFHPFTTPSGVVLTDVGPADHRHHRGIFFAWLQLKGEKEADFWGWGAYAPTKDRKVVNRSVTNSFARGDEAGFTIKNEWLAEGVAIMEEEVRAVTRETLGVRVLDLTYKLTPKIDLTHPRWAFSGFCVRLKKDGQAVASSPDGVVKLPAPNHMKPDSDWPDKPWYDFTFTQPDGKSAGAAVINHPANLPTLWHNGASMGMLNPCVVAPAEVVLKKDKPITLRYLVVGHDGAAPTEVLNKLAAEWRKQ